MGTHIKINIFKLRNKLSWEGYNHFVELLLEEYENTTWWYNDMHPLIIIIIIYLIIFNFCRFVHILEIQNSIYI